MIGDVLVSLDGSNVADVADVHAQLGPEKVGSHAALRIIRAGTVTEVAVTVGERGESDD